MALPGGLLEDAKKYLEITWTDADTDNKLSGMLSRSMAWIDRLAGKANDYTQDFYSHAPCGARPQNLVIHLAATSIS